MLTEGFLEVSVWEQYLLKSYLPYAKSLTKHYNGEVKDIKSHQVMGILERKSDYPENGVGTFGARW